jgi:hypothetical protein
MTTAQTTRINRAWLLKRVILPGIVLFVLGVWGFLDATVIYPKSGRLDASLKFKNYLQAAEDARRLAPGFVKIDDPAAELTRLQGREKSTAEPLTPMEKARLEWLRAMKVDWDISKDSVWIGDVKRALISKTGDEVYSGVGGVSEAKQEKVALFVKPRSAEAFVRAGGADTAVPFDEAVKLTREFWATAKTPSPLAAYDLPLQWLFTFVGLAGTLYLLVLIVRVRSRVYSFEPETHTLVLPGGERLAAADLKEVDKRKWHKFYVTLEAKDGRSRTLDLYRYEPLEDWVLSMEKSAFPEQVREAEEAARAATLEPDALAVPASVGNVAPMTYGGMMDGVFAMFVFDADALARAGHAPAAYAQGEVLKALGVALRDEGGWRQWLTASTGTVRGSAAAGAVAFMTGAEPTSKPIGAEFDGAYDAALRAPAPAGSWYVVVVGRLSEESASRASEVLRDPPPAAFAGYAAMRVHPPTIERFQEPLGLEPGLEVKGDVLVGPWGVSAEDAETAGLKTAADASTPG